MLEEQADDWLPRPTAHFGDLPFEKSQAELILLDTVFYEYRPKVSRKPNISSLPFQVSDAICSTMPNAVTYCTISTKCSDDGDARFF
jgi:hypothetical protein